MKGLVDLIYGVKRKRRLYEENNPGEKILAADGSKGIVTLSNKEIQRGIDWVTSKRAVVMLTNKNIISGDWIIPLDDIIDAKLLKVSSLLGSGQVLKIQTNNGKNYQFGMQFNTEWIEQQKLLLTYEEAVIKHSVYSITVRLFLLAYALYWIYRNFIL